MDGKKQYKSDRVLWLVVTTAGSHALAPLIIHFFDINMSKVA